jgi:hypothetical protein
VGLEKQSPFDTVFDRGNRLPLIVVDTFYGVVALLVVLVTLIVFFRLARKTNLIRDAAAETDVVGTLKPFNLGRAQMAFWFLLICISYVVIWLVTGALDTINASLLGLMGISAGTALSEAMIDSDKEAKKDKTGDQVAAVPDLVPVIGPPVPPARSHGFLRDILSGGADYSFHRFQIWVWTMVLGVIFISDVYNSLSMPTFSTTLLGLMGISSGTFIGFKFPEKK